MSKKVAMITGVTGQDGAYLSELLLNKNYFVHGVKRRSSSFNTQRIDHIFKNENLILKYGDLIDSTSILKILSEINNS